MTRTASLVAVVALLAAGACSSGSGGSPRPATPAPGVSGDAAAVAPQAPRVDGPVALTLRPAFTVMGSSGCEPSERLACGADDTSYRVFGRPRPVTLREAVAELNTAHTSWSATLLLERGDTRRASASAEEAAASGGVVLVLDDTGAVALALGPDDVEGGRLRATSLDKATAWGYVRTLAAG